MIQSPFLRGVLVVVLAAFSWFSFSLVAEGGPGVVMAIILGLVSLTAAVGFAFPGRSRIALRITAAAVVLAYLGYFGSQLVLLFRGQQQSIELGQPSALMAGLGLLVWGIPLLVYALTGRSPRERAYAAARTNDASGVLMDRETLDALEAAGADLSLPTETIFHLVFPTEAHARSAESVAAREGYRVQSYVAGDGATEWICCITQELVPEWENIRGARSRFTELANALGGHVDGWEAAVRHAR